MKFGVLWSFVEGDSRRLQLGCVMKNPPLDRKSWQIPSYWQWAISRISNQAQGKGFERCHWKGTEGISLRCLNQKNSRLKVESTLSEICFVDVVDVI